MRLLLDHNLSGRGIGGPLRSAGHDVRALQEEPEMDGIDDEDVLALATAEARIVVTRNSRHFAPIAREWADVGRSHAGLILVWSFDTDEFANIVAGIEHCFALYPSEERWRDLVIGI